MLLRISKKIGNSNKFQKQQWRIIFWVGVPTHQLKNQVAEDLAKNNILAGKISEQPVIPDEKIWRKVNRLKDIGLFNTSSRLYYQYVSDLDSKESLTTEEEACITVVPSSEALKDVMNGKKKVIIVQINSKVGRL